MNEINEDPEFLEAYRESDQRIKNVIEYLQKNPSCKILLKDLSGIALLSPCHLQRIFKKAVGLTPKEYLLRLRVKMTMQLLKQGLTLSEIVSLTGFTDKSHLTRTFRQITGVTPKSYAERINDQ
jgi:transcriptional regulator GlxA family with amidase domain